MIYKLLLIDIGGTNMRHAITSSDSNDITNIFKTAFTDMGEFEEKLKYRAVGGDASGLTLVGENGPEIVDFKTAVNIVPAHRTQETMKTLGESGGTNIVAMDLPPISTPLPEVNVAAPPSTETERIPSVNPFNSYMVMTPEILRIS